MKKDIVVYYSKNNTTKETIERIKKTSKNDVEIFDLNNKGNIDISQFERIFIGCGIYGDHLQKKVINFLKCNAQLLKSKKTIFFIHGIISEASYRKIVENDVKKYVDLNKSEIFYLGGKIDIEKQNFFIKKMIFIIAKKNNFDPYNNSSLSEQKISEFLKLFTV